MEFSDSKITTQGFKFSSVQVNISDEKYIGGNFYNIMIEPKFAFHSTQMLRLLDIQASKLNRP